MESILTCIASIVDCMESIVGGMDSILEYMDSILRARSPSLGVWILYYMHGFHT
jgi:hypothetical protein